jgi:hypothetical protein
MCLFLSPFFFAREAWARVVEDVEVRTLPDGYEINIRFLLQLQYNTRTPNQASRHFFVQLKTVNFQTLSSDEVNSLRDRVFLSWNELSGIPLKEMTFEGGDPERPQMTFSFTEDVDLSVRNSVDLRSIIVTIKTQEPPPQVSLKKKEGALPSDMGPAGKEIPEAVVPQSPEEIPPSEMVIPSDKDLTELMTEARDFLLKGENDRAVQLYTKILLTAEGTIKQQSQEFLGVARERNNQLAHAKAEYEKYLQEYPQGPDADRVRQRLAGLITAAQVPKERLKEAKRKEPEFEAKKPPKWSAQYFGNLSQFFFRDQTTLEGGTTQIKRYDLSSDLDFNSRLKSEKMDASARFTGGYQDNFLEGGRDVKSISSLSVDMRQKQAGWYARGGRQSLSSGGVLGRFDGVHLSKVITPSIKMNTVYGHPVESSRNTEIQTDKKFYGFNVDWGTFLQKWNFNTFFIEQTNSGLTDRRAVGGEVRYFDPQKAYYSLMDYDVFYNELDIFLFNGHITLPSKTTFNLAYDFRKSPLLMTNNAIQGQGVEELSDLFSRFSDEEIKRLALDRTTNSKSLTGGITQDIKQDLQWNIEATISELEGTITSGGVEGVESTGLDYFYSTQLVASNVLLPEDVLITGLGYSDTAQYHTYTLNLNTRFPITRNIRLIPRFRFDYRDNKDNDDSRFTIRPIGRVDYVLTRWMRFEVETGFEWLTEKTLGTVQKSTEAFVSAGYRLSF